MAAPAARSAASIRLYHCPGARSLRVLWAMRELELVDYNLITMPFPPRFTLKQYLSVNRLGTIPYMTDADNPELGMTESCAAPVYLAGMSLSPS